MSVVCISTITIPHNTRNDFLMKDILTKIKKNIYRKNYILNDSINKVTITFLNQRSNIVCFLCFTLIPLCVLMPTQVVGSYGL